MDCVLSILDDVVAVEARDPGTIRALLGHGARLSTAAAFELPYADDAGLALHLAWLRDLGLPMAGGAGWPPSEVFRLLRSRGLLAGGFTELTYKSPGDPVLRES
ncbi:MAG: hypothetical protein KA224_04355 [Steroidobacteraceae bacterium]|jgi:hypothetical protein|nr:hypothetical protein [Steroidobacteraceae bacterium]MCC7200239.1 hypothetical protein [Gammaproteobacteria bacterium]